MSALLASAALAARFETLRNSFPSLSRVDTATGKPVVYFDGPAGSQVPRQVIDAISDYYLHHNANSAGLFPTSRETNAILADALSAAVDWFGGTDENECFFGANMTTITLGFSRALSRTWRAGDRVLVTQLDHDGNVTPWRLAARDAGAECDVVRVNVPEATIDEDDFLKKVKLGPKLVAFTAASNSVGTANQIAKLTELAHQFGAEVYVDAVHWAPHRLIDVREWDVDYCVCSAYKFFGPHVGMLWGRKKRLEDLVPYKLRASPAVGPGKWMTGTQNFAAISGVRAAIDYIASIGDEQTDTNVAMSRRTRLKRSFELIESYEQGLLTKLIAGLKSIEGITVFGITDQDRFGQRVPTVVFDVAKAPSAEIAKKLGEAGIFCWHGHYYAIDICDALGQAERGMVRVGILHTNTSAEIDRLLEELRAIG
jgi:cysteine desulfurase family protein (TIGR01976 family)